MLLAGSREKIMRFLKIFLFILVVLFLLTSCSKEKEADTQETKSYQAQSEEIGHEAARMIKVPMENAQDAVDQENERMKDYEKHLQE